MSGYFDDILESYAPPDRAFVMESPWPDPFADSAVPKPAVPDADPPDDSGGEAAPRASVQPPRPVKLHAPLRDAAHVAEGDDLMPAPDPAEVPERIIAQETRIVETRSETPSPSKADDDIPVPEPIPDIHLHENVDRSTTHFYDHTRIVEGNSVFESEPVTPEAAPLTDAPHWPCPMDTGPDPALAAIEARLAGALTRLHSKDAPPSPFLSPDDFEPDAPDTPLPPDIEAVREITREVVMETHHHHTIETRIEPPAAPPPRTAAEASRIGPIRFVSAWKTGGR